MKKLILPTTVVCCCIMLLTSCTVAMGDGFGKKLEPSKNTTTRTYELTPFDAIAMSAVGSVRFVQTPGEDHFRLVLTAPENYVELYEVKVHDKELSIGFARRNTNIEGKHVSMTVYGPQLRRVDNGGVGSFAIEGLNTANLEIFNSGVGNISIDSLTAQRVDIDCSGVGNVTVSGTASSADLDCSGVGNIKAEDLQADDVRADVSGVGGIRCHAVKRIEGDVSGVGSLKYGGNPTVKELHRSGVGKIGQL